MIKHIALTALRLYRQGDHKAASEQWALAKQLLARSNGWGYSEDVTPCV